MNVTHNDMQYTVRRDPREAEYFMVLLPLIVPIFVLHFLFRPHNTGSHAEERFRAPT